MKSHASQIEQNFLEDEVHTLLNEPFKNHVFEEKSVTGSLQNLAHTINEFEKNASVTFLVYDRLNETELSGLLVDGSSRKRLKNMAQEIQKDFKEKIDVSFKPEKGDIIACDTAYRGLVLHEPTRLYDFYKIFLIDFGYVSHCKNIANLSPAFLNVPFSAVRCTIMSNFENQSYNYEKFFANNKFQFKLTSVESNNCCGTLCDSADKSGFCIEVNFRPYVPTVDMFGLAPLQLYEEQPLVRMCSFITARNCYIKAGDEESEERRLRLLDAVNYQSLKSEWLNECPFIGDVVAVFYRNSYWRAVVQKFDGKKCSVDLVDKGKEIDVSPELLKKLPDFLKMPNRTTQKIKLANVRIIEKNSFLEKFLEEDEIFELYIDEQNEVILHFTNSDKATRHQIGINLNETANEHIHRLLEPVWLVLHNRGSAIDPPKLTHLHVTSNEWPVGSFKYLKIVDMLPESSVFSVMDEKSDARRIYEEMNLEKRLDEFVSYFDDTYVPNIDEICITRKSKNDKWERALCVNRSDCGGKLWMQLLDSGMFTNVWHLDVRRIGGEFLKYPIGVKLAQVENPDNFDLSMLVNADRNVYCEIVEDQDMFCVLRIPNLRNYALTV